MPLDRTGILNESDFYTAQYFATLLDSDLKPPSASAVADLARVGQTWADTRAELAATTDITACLEIQRAWLRPFVHALGYQWRTILHTGEEECLVPLVGEVKYNNRPHLWLIEAVDPSNDLADPLTLPVAREQITEPGDLTWADDATWEDILSDHVFAGEYPPRWVLLFHASELVLIDRSKWPQRRLLRFHFEKLFAPAAR